MPCPLAIVGYSGSGKTRLIMRLIAHAVARGTPVSAIKHTHHPIGELWKGDTRRFLESGAREVVLASAADAALMTLGPPSRIPSGWREEAESIGGAFRVCRGAWSRPGDLVDLLTSELILVEGFRSEPSWSRIVVVRREILERERARRPGTDPLAILAGGSAVAAVSDEPLELGLPVYSPEDIDGIAAFVDRICH